MNNDTLDQLNIINLTTLWKRMLAVQNDGKAASYQSERWPHRYWIDPQFECLKSEDPSINSQHLVTHMQQQLRTLEHRLIVPLWCHPMTEFTQQEQLLIEQGFELSFKQTAMVLDISDIENTMNPTHNELLIRPISQDSDIQIWVDIASQSFSYQVDIESIQTLVDDPDVRLLLAYTSESDGQIPVATALMFRTDEIMGIHMVGVPEEHRGKGIAGKLMAFILRECQAHTSSLRYITLQASVLGEGLYKRLGFHPQFEIRNYQRPEANIAEKH